jgi:hypothetical protein
MLAGRRSLLDVGGAPGAYSIALCQRYPALRATILDSIDALRLSAPVLEQFDMSGRILLKEAAEQREGFGRNEYDALLMSRNLPGDEASALSELVRSYNALRPGGLMILPMSLLDSDLNGTVGAAFFHMLYGTFTLDQLRALIAEAGFERAALLYREEQGGDIVIAYKPMDESEEDGRFLMEYVSPEQEMFGWRAELSRSG